MKHRILALSQDRGSMQAIAPVVTRLCALDSMQVATCSTPQSSPITTALGLPATPFNQTAFATRPSDYIRELFDQHQPDLVLMGSSPAHGKTPQTPEQFAILEAHRRGLKSLSVLDYWGMYTERFSLNGQTVAHNLLPNRLCVLDSRCQQDLKAWGVPAHQMAITHNPWLDKLASQALGLAVIQTPAKHPGIAVVLASQPLAHMQSVRKWPYTQYTVFENLLQAMQGWTEQTTETWDHETNEQQPKAPIKTKLQIVPHPSENPADWQRLLARTKHGNVHIELLHHQTPDLLRGADYLVTSHSTLAYEALYFGTPCISLRPSATDTMNLWIEQAGLSQLFHDAESLLHYLVEHNPATERQRILALKEKWQAQKLFFQMGKPHNVW
ncbi:MAG: hypothetical protein HC848_01615 [Limnobacter sp.]|nr:hypothetical protein [Limnobacter sp.]